MTHIPRFARGPMRSGFLLGAVLTTITACDLKVTNPSVIDAGQFNPTSDGTLISLSAQTQWYKAFQSVTRYGGLFAGEQRSGAARTEVTDIGRRNIFTGNQDINVGFFAPLSGAITGNLNVIDALGSATGASSDINIARAQMNLAFALELMAETFCQGVIRAGPALTPAQLLDSAITHYTAAIAVASAATGAEAVKIVTASRIGLSRAYLQKGDNGNAATAAAAVLVPANVGFTFSVPTVDDAANRALGNQIYLTTIPSQLDVVDTNYRLLNDPRVPFKDAGANAQDGVLRDYQQQKYLSYASPLRIASYLEAQYVQAEAKLKTGDPSFALALIAARRAVGGQPAFSGTATADILTELLSQSARDFFLEAKKLGDWRRNPTAEPLISPPGAVYKGGLTFGNLTSIPLPAEEVNTNPNHITACP
ncbi:MAG: hypothetical protein M3081_10210 [Gemmatimonadota bacterium]|nr:hypothetical protein [Gemmatimonadota bacterium]